MIDSSHQRTFTAGEIALIAGLSTGLQREWRRQRILPEKADRGWTRVSLDVVTWIFILKKLADAGYPLKEAQEAAGVALPHVQMAMAKLLVEASERKREAFSNRMSGDYSNRAHEAALSSKWIEGSAAINMRRYLIFLREADRADNQPVRVIALDDLNAVPDNLVVWTAMDNRRAAAAILDGVRRIDEKKDGGE